MKKGSLISVIVALIAVAGALLGLVAYMRSRRCLECGDVEEDYTPDADVDGEYDMDYYVESQPQTAPSSAGEPVVPEAEPIVESHLQGDDITE